MGWPVGRELVGFEDVGLNEDGLGELGIEDDGTIVVGRPDGIELLGYRVGKELEGL